MTSIVTRKFRIYNAQQFVESFSEISSANEPLTQTPLPTESLNSINYIFIAKSSEWPNSDTLVDPVDQISETDYQHWREMLSAARVDSGDISSVTRKYTWTLDTAYREYDDQNSTLFSNIVHTGGSSDPSNQPFFVTVEDSLGVDRVYKCLNNADGAQSTIKPEHVGHNPDRKSDGYVWKLMFDDNTKFNTANFIATKPAFSNSIFTTISPAGAVYNIKPAESGATNFIFLAGNTSNMTAGDTQNVDIPRGTISTSDVTRLVGSSFIVNSIDSPIRDFRVINSATISGSIIALGLDSNITIPSGGEVTFFVSPRVTIDGNGDESSFNAIAAPFINWRTTRQSETIGAIQEIDIDIREDILSGDFSSGFTDATAAAEQDNGNIVDSLRPIIGIPQGHGSSPIEELDGKYAMVSKELPGSIVDPATNAPTFTVANNFRKIGLLRNPEDSNGNRITVDSIDQTFRIPITEATDTELTNLETSGADFLGEDHILTQETSETSGVIIDHFSYVDINGITQFRVRLTDVQKREDYINDDFTKQLEITNTASMVVGTIEASDNPEDGIFQQFTGEMIYVEHREGLRRSSDQTENVRLVIEF